MMFSTSNLWSQTTHNITDPAQLTTLSASLGPGDTVILADGTYTSNEMIKFIPTTGTAAMPITFKAATPGGVKFTGGLKLKIGGDHCIVDGFHWQGGDGASNFIEFRDGSDYAYNSTIQNCVIDGLQGTSAPGTSVKHNWIVLYGNNNTVINCSFLNKTTSGNIILAEYRYNASPDGSGTPNTRCDEVGHIISNNYFYNYAKIDPSLTNSGDSETIRIGTSEYQNVNSNALVSNNYFVQADGENEIITNKSKGNTYTNNTFRRCRGSLVLRHGSHTTVDGNFFLGENVEGTGGIRIVDSYQTITNNYIQDCITENDNAIWNNGITFLGGNDSSAVVCSSTSMTNGYQKVTNLNLSNNTIVNTNAPLFYNVNTGTTDPTGTVANNLIYFADSNPNTTPVISGNTATAYADLGVGLTYSGNEFKGTTLGATNAGFTENTGITATPDGEIFSFSGASGKGATISSAPITDAMVGYGIGACFVNHLGTSIADGNCTIEIPESLIVSSLPTLTFDAGSYNVTVTANVSWTAASNDAWITIDTNSASGDAIVSVTVTENTDTNNRTGSVTFTQEPGGDDIVKTLSLTQEGADLTQLYDLINTGDASDPVTIHSFSKEEANGIDKFNYASKTLDKNFNTHWTADDGALVSGDYKGDGEYVIYDLSEEYQLDLIQIATDNKADPYGLQIWVSTTGTDTGDFTKALPTTGDLLITTTTGVYDEYDQYQLTANARYVKLIGYGRFNTAGDTRKSVWNNITEIEFYGQANSLSTYDYDLNNKISMYPNPAKDILTIKHNGNNIDLVQVFGMDGRKVLEKKIQSIETEIKLDVSSISNGAYIITISNNAQNKQSKMMLVSH
ncbi:chondroitinase-B domain-containing protein [Geojedonia litorea]|uniref:Chondroitinase-B domain-containing protein n=1 Tax=Geojedonia litorea TaxID=1268269 RepID=A0ABV9N4W9_9FLAO